MSIYRFGSISRYASIRVPTNLLFTATLFLLLCHCCYCFPPPPFIQSTLNCPTLTVTTISLGVYSGPGHLCRGLAAIGTDHCIHCIIYGEYLPNLCQYYE
ncbi:hypothetical protein F4810DRAFT_687034 [Camillea tinctor]|nr:hypothetical protein F4810DRAFT_687034 [Camillea tinctor]